MGLTVKQERFAQCIADGMTQADAYRASYDAENMGDGPIYVEASRLMDDPNVSLRVAKLRDEIASMHLWTRKDSIDALKDALDIAKGGLNASAITGAVKELNLMHGYNEPVKHEVKNTGIIGVAEMSKDELIEAMKERGLPTSIFDGDGDDE